MELRLDYDDDLSQIFQCDFVLLYMPSSLQALHLPEIKSTQTLIAHKLSCSTSNALINTRSRAEGSIFPQMQSISEICRFMLDGTAIIRERVV